MSLIQIDYVNGTHGSFLMHVINNLENGTCIIPFVKHQAGAAHKLIPYNNKIADRGHYSVKNGKDALTNVVSINMENDDLLMVTELLMHRWNHFDPDELDKNTFYKVNKAQYRLSFMRMYEKYALDTKTDVPRHILREYFKRTLDTNSYNDSLGDSLSKFLIEQQQMLTYSDLDIKVMKFEFKWFYDYEAFKLGIVKIKNFFELDYEINEDTLLQMHSLFIENNPAVHMNDVYKIFDAIKNNKIVEIPKLKLLQEAWLNLQIEKLTNKSMFTVEYFNNTSEIYEHLNKQDPDVIIQKPNLVTI